MLNDLKNCAVETTSLFKSSDEIHYKRIDYKSVISDVKKIFEDKYSYIQAHIAVATVKKLVESFNAFVELKNKKIDKKHEKK